RGQRPEGPQPCAMADGGTRLGLPSDVTALALWDGDGPLVFVAEPLPSSTSDAPLLWGLQRSDGRLWVEIPTIPDCPSDDVDPGLDVGDDLDPRSDVADDLDRDGPVDDCSCTTMRRRHSTSTAAAVMLCLLVLAVRRRGCA